MKRAYQPLLFAFAIALGLYICSMKSPKDSFYGTDIPDEGKIAIAVVVIIVFVIAYSAAINGWFRISR